MRFGEIRFAILTNMLQVEQLCVCCAEAAPVAGCQSVGGSRSHKNIDETCAENSSTSFALAKIFPSCESSKCVRVNCKFRVFSSSHFEVFLIHSFDI